MPVGRRAIAFASNALPITPALLPGEDVKLCQHVAIQGGDADDAPSRFGHPDFLVWQDDIRNPGSILVRGVQIWQIGQRLAH